MYTNVAIYKGDYNNHQYPLKDAEFTLFTDSACMHVAKDVNGQDAIAVSNSNGRCSFNVPGNVETTRYYARETRAPFGYKINNETFIVRPTPDSGKANVGLARITILDMITVIPPKMDPEDTMYLYDDYGKLICRTYPLHQGSGMQSIYYYYKNGVPVDSRGNRLKAYKNVYSWNGNVWGSQLITLDGKEVVHGDLLYDVVATYYSVMNPSSIPPMSK